MEKITERLSTDYFVHSVCAERFFYFDGKPKMKIYYSFLMEREPVYALVDDSGDYVQEIRKSEFDRRISEMKAA